MSGTGVVYLVGAGPGSPGLLTLRGRDCLAEADAVLYDYLVNPQILELAAATAERTCLGQHGRTKIWTQNEINQRLIELARQGKRVVRLKSGDPVVFARAAEEAEALAAAGIPLEIVPGVTAALAAGSCAGIPLTHRDCASAVALVTGQERDGKGADALDYRRLAQFPGTLAIYMGVTTADRWSSELIEGGLPPDTPAALVRRVSFSDQQTWTGTLAELAGQIRDSKLRPPVIALIGPAARQQAALGWFESRPLFGRRVLVTRPRHQAEALARPLERLGAAVDIHGAIEILPPESWQDVDESIAALDDGRWDWVVFSSANGVRCWLDRLLESRDARALGPARLAGVGPVTSQTLGEYCLRSDLTPGVYRAEGLADELARQLQPGARVLLIRASRGREVLAQRLAAAGAEVTQVVAYRSVDAGEAAPAIVERMRGGGYDWTTVTSSAIARSLQATFGEALQRTRLASISPVTTGTLQELGLEAAAEAEQYTMEGVVAAIERAVRS